MGTPVYVAAGGIGTNGRGHPPGEGRVDPRGSQIRQVASCPGAEAEAPGRLFQVERRRRVDAREFDVIAARHMDRLLRRLAELESVLERCRKTGTAIVTAADGVDASSDGGRLVARILSSVAQGEVERKSARQRSAVAQAAKQGRWCGGRRAFGYEPDGVTVHEDEAVIIKQGYADVLAGESLSEIARRWNAAGFTTGQGKPWSRYAVKDVLTNPRNAGLRRHRSPEDRANIRQNPELGILLRWRDRESSRVALRAIISKLIGDKRDAVTRWRTG